MFLLPRESEHVATVYSSLTYCMLGIFLFIQDINLIVAIIAFTTGIIAFTSHSFPKNVLLNILDWGLSLALALFVLTGYKITSLDLLLGIISILIWLLSLYFFRKTGKMRYYTLTHSIWHILSALVLLLIFKN